MNRFDGAAATWDDELKLLRARRVAELLRDELALQGDERVLEVGCGTGQLSIQLADSVAGGVLSDTSPGMLAKARENLESAGLGRRWDVLELDLSKGQADLAPMSFDGIWTMLALHHIVELDALLARAHALLRLGGWIAIVDLDKDPDGAFHAHVGDDFDGHHGFDREELSEALRRVGFSRIHMRDAGQVEKEVGEHVQPFPLFLALAHRS